LVTGLGYAFTGEASGKRGLLRKLIQKLYRFGLSKGHKVFFQNPDDQALFRQLDLLPVDIPSCVVNGSGVDVADYSVAPLRDEPSFLLIARLLGDKGVREYANAARKVKLQHPQVSFKLVGWIDDNPDAIGQHELDEWVNSGTLEFLGKLTDVRPAIAGSNVYVLPSYREGTPRTVLEAMAMGRPVITTDAPGCRETVVDGDNGFLVSVQSVDELVSAIIRFIEEPELTARMGQRSRQIAEETYDVHKVNEFMLSEMGIQ
jgi:glycosyltransferase involved in cell wall biosynthesis